MTVFVTGAAGFIGRHVSKAVARTGAKVIGIGHGNFADHAQWGVAKWVQGDIDDSNLEIAASQFGAPEILFHLAGGSSVGPSIEQPLEDFRRTVLSTAQLLDWTRRRAPTACVLAASSAAVYGDVHSAPISEAASLSPLSPYGAHKLMMEQLLSTYGRSFGVRGVIARPFSVYGAGLRKQLLWDLWSRLKTGADPVMLGGTGSELRDWVHVGDVASALVALTAEASTEIPIVNIGGGQGVSGAGIAEMLASALGRPGAVSFSGITRPGNPSALVADPAKLLSCGWRPGISLIQGIEDYARWLENQA